MSRMTHLLTDTISYKVPGGFDSSGDPASLGSLTTAAARHEQGSFKVQDDEGNERMAQDRITTETDIAANALLWLPGADTSDNDESKQIIKKRKASTPNADITLIELYL